MATPYTDEELVLIRESVASAMESTERRGITAYNAHPMLPRLLATIDRLRAQIKELQ